MHGSQGIAPTSIAETTHGRRTVTHARWSVVAASLVVIGGAATILGAYFFQYVMGLPPCPLCLEQRIAFYFAIPLALLLAVGVRMKVHRALIATGFIVISLGMLFNAVLAVYHAGIEWKWWPGPLECSGQPADFTAGDLASQLNNLVLVRCDEAAWRFLGLSLAGYDVLISLALSAIAAFGLAAAIRARKPA